jgi:predicted DNA-binding transcriptional regulator YafY
MSIICYNKHFTVTTKVYLSQQFYGWLFGFGNRAKVLPPTKVKQEYAEQLKKLLGMYEYQKTTYM